MDNPFKSPAILSFCPGILGLERGLARAGVRSRVLAYVEIEAFIIANLVAGMESGMVDPAPIWTDAKTFDARPFRGKIHGIIGGYPCPGESLAGLREGHLYKGFLWPAIRRAIAATRPLWCFFENVDDHLTGTYPIVLRSLRNMGYAAEAGVYSAEEVGAPHERKRLFILAISNTARQQNRWLFQSWLSTHLGAGGEKLANGYSDGYRTGAGGFIETSIKVERKTQRKEWEVLLREWLRDVPWDSGQKLVNAQGFSKREPTGRAITQPEEGNKGTQFSIRRHQWPAQPGCQQFEWEEIRTTEPGLGCTIDGYNFREDLLRALGNSVVEQTAEIAFIDLLKKHLIQPATPTYP